MTSSELPDELAELQGFLAGRQHVEPSANFHRKLVAAMRQELLEGSAAPLVRRGWQFAAAVAAAVMLWANFSMSVANDMNWRLVGDPEPSNTNALSAELRGLFPEMSEQEINQQALIVQGESQLHVLINARALAQFAQAMSERLPGDWN